MIFSLGISKINMYPNLCFIEDEEGLASSVSSLHVNHPYGAFFCSDCPLPLTQQCNRVHAVVLNEPGAGQIGSSSRQLSFVPLIMGPRYILNISWFQQLCMCGTLYLVVVRIPLRKCLITILIAVYLSRLTMHSI